MLSALMVLCLMRLVYLPGLYAVYALCVSLISRDFMLSALMFRSFKVYHIREVCKEALKNVPQFVGLFNIFQQFITMI